MASTFRPWRTKPEPGSCTQILTCLELWSQALKQALSMDFLLSRQGSLPAPFTLGPVPPASWGSNGIRCFTGSAFGAGGAAVPRATSIIGPSLTLRKHCALGSVPSETLAADSHGIRCFTGSAFGAGGAAVPRATSRQ